MELIGRKRRLDESPFVLQSKMHVNEKMMNCSNSDKMKQIHQKTVSRLFKASRVDLPKDVTNRAPKVLPLYQQLVLKGNGIIEYTDESELCEYLLERLNSKCCQRKTYVQDTCNNCTLPLCEYCGHSCSDCGTFLCNNCVLLFGCSTGDEPICEKCKLYH